MAPAAARHAAIRAGLVIALAILLTLAQDTTALSPKARAMLGRFSPPTAGEVSVATRFSTDTAWLGEQVELVTAAWFPRDLRDRLRRPPTLRSPSLSGLWSVQSQGTPALAASRFVGGQIYDLFVAHQTIFPLGEGTIEAPPATLSYAVPASSSFFAPETRRTLSSRPVTLVIRGIPPALAAAVGGGPTAHGLQITWSVPTEGLRTGTPVLVELVVRGEGNITLWPAPQVAWPPGVRVYPERTEERPQSASGRLGGEKRFRFTLVADSVGVVTLPRVRYPYFDPAQVQVHVPAATATGLPVLTGVAASGRTPPVVTAGIEVPVATTIITRWWPWLLALAMVPGLWLVMRRRRPPQRQGATDPAEPEVELRRLLGSPVQASPELVSGTLRRRGITRGDADAVHGWLSALVRRQYGPPDPGGDEPVPGTLGRILARLRRGFVIALLCGAPSWLSAQSENAVDRYRAGDFPGAAREFAEMVSGRPTDAILWRNLAAARSMSGDDVGAAAAWLRALSLAPRDGTVRRAWTDAATVPADVRALAPRLPISRDELLLLAFAVWMVTAAAAIGRRPDVTRVAAVVLAAVLLVAAVRSFADSRAQGLVRPASRLRVSPHPAAPMLGDAAPWSLARLERSERGWWLVRLPDGRRGWLVGTSVATLGAGAR